MTGVVLSDWELSDKFNISNGVDQGCVLAPVLFNLYFTQVLLRVKVMQQKGICPYTKLKVYNRVVVPSLLYGCET